MLLDQDPSVATLLKREIARQENSLSLIASENIVSRAVMEAVGSEFTNKYAEGYPGKRYYGGCEIHDELESLSIERAKKLFGCEHVNVQPHSGSTANMVAYFALVKPGENVLSMDLDHGGHLTHGSKVNFSGKWFNIFSYGVGRDTGRIDYDQVEKMAREINPKVIIAGASAYSRIIDFERFSKIAKSVGAFLLVDMAHIAGLVAGGVHPSPVPYADIVTSTTHKSLRGPRGGLILCREEFKKSVDSWVFPGMQGGPLMHEIAGKAVCFGLALKPEFREYQKQVVSNAKALGQTLVGRGLKLVSGGTDNHLILIDLSQNKITGKEAEDKLSGIGIVANKNKIPFDERPPTVTSGVRLGTPSITTRGMAEAEMAALGNIIADVILGAGNSEALKAEVAKLCRRFPIN